MMYPKSHLDPLHRQKNSISVFSVSSKKNGKLSIPAAEVLMFNFQVYIVLYKINEVYLSFKNIKQMIR